MKMKERMAGTDKRKADAAKNLPEGPAFILVVPQLGDNIGAAARAMLNFSLTDMRLVAPRDGWPNPRAWKAASGADSILDEAQVTQTTAEAVAGLDFVLATTARPRDMVKPVYTPEEGIRRMRAHLAKGGKPGFLFGPERTGLHNDDLALADAIVTVPLNPGFSSLNLAQAVLLMAYEWNRAGDTTPPAEMVMAADTRPANKAELLGLFEHLESELDAASFLRPPEKRAGMIRNIRNIFQRAGMTEQEVRTFRGIVTALTKHARRRALEDFEAEKGGK